MLSTILCSLHIPTKWIGFGPSGRLGMSQLNLGLVKYCRTNIASQTAALWLTMTRIRDAQLLSTVIYKGYILSYSTIGGGVWFLKINTECTTLINKLQTKKSPRPGLRPLKNLRPSKNAWHTYSNEENKIMQASVPKIIPWHVYIKWCQIGAGP